MTFISHKKLVYFHNDYGYIDDKGVYLGPREHYYPYHDMLIQDSVKRRVTDLLIAVTWASLFNCAMAIKKEIVEKGLIY